MGLFSDILEGVKEVTGAISGNPLISGGMSLIGGMMANNANQENFSASNAYNAREAQLSRDWQERMSNTQYQRAVADMKAAGLNPMLAYSKGGAGTPSGATANAASAQPIKDVSTPAIQSAAQALQMENMKMQNELIEAQTQKTRAETQTERDMRYKLLGAQADSYRTGIATGETQQHLNITSANKALQETANLKVEHTRIWEQIDNLKAQTKTEGERAILTHLQQALTRAQTAVSVGQLPLQTWQTAVAEMDALLKNSANVGAGEEAKFQAGFGQVQRIIRMLNPLSRVLP